MKPVRRHCLVGVVTAALVCVAGCAKGNPVGETATLANEDRDTRAIEQAKSAKVAAS